VINTGSRARIDDTPGLSESRPLTHVEALDLDHLPEHLIVLGGGYVGLELAQAFRRFGSRVTVVERNGSLIHREDPDVTEAIERLFRDEGIEVLTGTAVLRVEGRSGQSVRLRAACGAIGGTHLLVAGGRIPNTDGIGLEEAGVETDERGHVKVNERLQTTAKDVWAVGDCAGSPYFTHIGVDDFRVVLDNLSGGNRVTTGRQVPFCLFTDPELAPGRAERTGGPRARRRVPPGQDPFGRRAADTDTFRDAGIPEGANRERGRPHPRLHRIRGRGRRSHGRRPSRDGGRPTVHGAAGHRPDTPDDGRGARRAVLVRAAGMTSEWLEWPSSAPPRSKWGPLGRVDRGGCPPRPPSDPGLHITRTRFLIS